MGFGDWGVDGGWTPLPTRPQQYCDPASLVSGVFDKQYVSKAENNQPTDAQYFCVRRSVRLLCLLKVTISIDKKNVVISDY